MKTSVTQCLMFIDSFSNGFKIYDEICSRGMVICLPDAEDPNFIESLSKDHHKITSITDYLLKNMKSFLFIDLDRSEMHDYIEINNISESGNKGLNIVFRRYYLSIMYKYDDIEFIALGTRDAIDHDFGVTLSKGDKHKKLRLWDLYKPKPNLLENLDLIEQKLKDYFEIDFKIHERCIECFRLNGITSNNIYSAIEGIINRPPRDSVTNKLPLVTGYQIMVDKKFIVYETTITFDYPKPTRIFYSKKEGIHIWGIGHFDK